MTGKSRPNNIEAIEAIFEIAPNDLTITEVLSMLTVEIPRRTLIRRLQYLVEQGKIKVAGRGRATRYAWSGKESRAAKLRIDKVPSQIPAAVPLSKPSTEIAKAMLRPVGQRTKASYKRDFLDGYEANKTAYLPKATKQHLAEIGRSGDEPKPAGTYGRQILDRLLIDLTFHSSRLEGNTYSILETKRLIEWGRVASGRDAEETQMVLNHKAAIEFILESVESGEAVNRRMLLNLHALLSDNLLGDPSASGRLRKGPVSIGGSAYLPGAVPQIIEECFGQIALVASQIEDPFEQSFFLTVHLPYLQPFEDVNKRVSRLAANIPLIRENLRPLSFVDVRKDIYTTALLGVYELNRIELIRDVYVWAYEKSAELYKTIRSSLGAPDEFRLKFRSEIKEVVREIIRGRVPVSQVVEFAMNWARDRLPTASQSRFIAVVEAELLGLHEGNYARYRVTQSEFDNWVESD